MFASGSGIGRAMRDRSYGRTNARPLDMELVLAIYSF